MGQLIMVLPVYSNLDAQITSYRCQHGEQEGFLIIQSTILEFNQTFIWTNLLKIGFSLRLSTWRINNTGGVYTAPNIIVINYSIISIDMNYMEVGGIEPHTRVVAKGPTPCCDHFVTAFFGA